ncbi:MAG: prepilin-type N-terminal cleavage/methylation domain-containing protein [Deltaproteobacteria bacterium]|nr:prepilin-type N-terminal cleavage/methylation domain-containing protein [Deltaproteobacteria bacterium]
MTRPRSSLAGQRGFSMIELLVAMLILSTALLGLGRVAIGVVQGNLRSRDHSVATFLAQDRIESLRGGGGAVAPATEDYGAIPDFPGFRRVTEVLRDTPERGLSTVTVTVSWDQGERSAVLRTLVGR